MSEPSPAQRLRRSRILITLFFVAIVALTMALTYGIAPRIQRLRVVDSDRIPLWTCIEVVSGDTIRVEKDDEIVRIHLAGIGCPPPERGPELDAEVGRLNIPTDELLEKSRIARDSLFTWINRRSALLDIVDDIAPTSADATEAYVQVGGVDLGKKILQHGQGYALDIPHPQRDDYKRYEEQARASEFGFWRVP